MESKEDFVIEEFKRKKNTEVAVAVAAIQTLVSVCRRSTARTLMGLQVEVKAASDRLVLYNKMSIPVTTSCEVFNKYITRTGIDILDFNARRERIIERGEHFFERFAKSREKIAQLVCRFVRDGTTILLHGWSRVAINSCKHATASGKHFSVVVTEGRPNLSGYNTAAELQEVGVPVTVILDSAVAAYMETVELVLLGAEGVAENGGLINEIGSFQISVVAKAYNKPVYVVAESCKFVRFFPLKEGDTCYSRHSSLSLADLDNASSQSSGAKKSNSRSEISEKGCPEGGFKALEGHTLPVDVKIDNPSSDYTPPQYLTLLFTDIGILTPSAVSDELIKLYS